MIFSPDEAETTAVPSAQSTPGIDKFVPPSSSSVSISTSGTVTPDVTIESGGLNLDWEANFTSLKKRDRTIALDWQDIKFSVKKKEILHGISGEARPGEVRASLRRADVNRFVG